MNKFLIIILTLNFVNNSYGESSVKAGDSLIWDSKNQSYTATGDVEFQNDKFIAFSDKMIAQYVEKDNKEIFTIVELFENVYLILNRQILHEIYPNHVHDFDLMNLTKDQMNNRVHK